MFFPYDPISEIVVHFLGYFEIAVEDMRLRQEIIQGERELEDIPEDADLVQFASHMRQSYTLGAYTPGVDYAPPEWLLRGDSPLGQIYVDLSLPSIELAIGIDQPPTPFIPSSPSLPLPTFIGPEPGSVIAVISQTITLSDDDVIVMSTIDAPIVFDSGAAPALLAMMAAGNQILGPMAGTMEMHGYDDVPRLINLVEDAVSGQHADAATEFHHVDSLAGTHVNGQSVEEAPELEDALPDNVRQINEPEVDPRLVEVTGEGSAHLQLNGDDVEGSVTYNSGGNHLVNQVAVLNAGVGATHFVVGGDLHQIDAIIQTNIYSDLDTVEAGFPLADLGVGETVAFNVATFIQETRDAAGEAAEAKPGVMPGTWQVTVVTGDIVFLEWMKQLTYVSDQDIGVLSASGSNTTITSGENLALNGVNFQNIGLFYDLILVGGNVFDANIIVQTNILYDNDTVGLLGAGPGDASGAEGHLNTGGNLLWNQATIFNVGAVDVENTISDHYGEAMQGLASGDRSMPAGFGSDDGLEGIAVPRVLYVSGNIYDLRYVEQTNILGDADFVALQKSAFLEGQPATDWQIDTGSNALVNIATIKDFDTFGDTMQVGGNHYSDAILIQAEILAGDGGNDGPDALVSEVVAFLDTDDVADFTDFAHADMIHDGTPVDLMQSVLA